MKNTKQSPYMVRCQKKQRKAIVMVAVLLFCMVAAMMPSVTFAQGDIPAEGVTYTLTYPDGTTVREKDGNPLTYDDVTEALKEENWKLLGSGYTSDKDGKVSLPATWTEGTIKVVETKVPAGYEKGAQSEVVANLKDGSVTFVNPKIKEDSEEDSFSITYKLNGGQYKGSTEDIVESYPKGTVIKIHEAPTRQGYTFDYWQGSSYQPGDPYTVQEDHAFTAIWKAEATPTPATPTKNVPMTGDSSQAGLWALAFLVSLLAVFACSVRRELLVGADGKQGFGGVSNDKKLLYRGLAIALVAVVLALLLATYAFAAQGFVIHKEDDNGDPVEGAVFDVYGKPEVRFEDIPAEETVDVTGTKVWVDDGRDHDNATEVKLTLFRQAGQGEIEEVAGVTPTWNGDVYTFATQPKADASGATYTYFVSEEDVEGYDREYTDDSGTQGLDFAPNGGTIVNTAIPVAGSITLNVNFNLADPNVNWVAKTVQEDHLEPVQETITVDGSEKEVYVYTYTADNVTKKYYGDWNDAQYVDHWYDEDGNEVTDADLKNALSGNAVLTEETVTKTRVTGLFKANREKQINVTGPNGFNKTYAVTVGQNGSIEIPITEAGEYLITHQVVTSDDIDNDKFTGELRTVCTDVFMIASAKVNVTKDGDDFTCSIDKTNAMISENTVNGPEPPYTLVPYDEIYAESEEWAPGGCNTSATGNTVTFNHYMRRIGEQ